MMRFYIKICLLALCCIPAFIFGKAHSYRHQLCACAVFQNEARFLKEWIEYHRLVGVEKFYLYNNNSTDAFNTVLYPYLNNGVVELIDWPYYHQNIIECNFIRCSAYQDVIQRS